MFFIKWFVLREEILKTLALNSGCKFSVFANVEAHGCRGSNGFAVFSHFAEFLVAEATTAGYKHATEPVNAA